MFTSYSEKEKLFWPGCLTKISAIKLYKSDPKK